MDTVLIGLLTLSSLTAAKSYQLRNMQILKSWTTQERRFFPERAFTTNPIILAILIAASSHSYRYIENSVRNGILEDLEDHRVGRAEGTVRSVGSTIQPPKGTRNKYTQDDDRILWEWVQQKPQKGGGTDGNEIYKQLEAEVRGGMRFARDGSC